LASRMRCGNSSRDRAITGGAAASVSVMTAPPCRGQEHER
jgi:hypothetical protein